MTESTESSLRGEDLAIVAGKGGVGKTVVSAALAVAAARSGRDVTLVEVEGKAHLSALFGVTSHGYEAVTAATSVDTGGGDIAIRTIGSDEALVEWLKHNGLGRVADRLARSGALEVVATATPGIKDLLVLGRVKQMFNESDDFVIIDAPASGHAITFLGSAAGLAETARVGVINRQASEVLAMLRDRSRSTVLLVGLAEQTPVLELLETIEAIDGLDIGIGGVVVNKLWAASDALREAAAEEGDTPAGRAARHVIDTVDRQQEALALLDEHTDIPRISLPLVDGEICRRAIFALADHLDGLFAP